MSLYEPQGWQAPARQPSWEQPPPPSRSDASPVSQREDGTAFATQFDEVDRAIDNLVKSGKFFHPGPARRDPTPVMMNPGRPMYEHGHRGHGSRHSNFYASQRHQSRHGEPDQMAQAKRRMAQQRERDLRNYHQEQQYNRSVLADMSSNKSDRSMSPSTISEEGRRELIARQHRALYGNEGGPYGHQPNFGEDQQTEASKLPGSQGPPSRGLDPFAAPGQNQQPRDVSQAVSQSEQSASPAGPIPPGFNKAPTPPGAEDINHSRQLSKSKTAPLPGNIAPIGSRPIGQQQPGQTINKRTTSPLPSQMSYGFNASEQNNEPAGSSNSNNAQKDSGPNSGMNTWGSGSGVWGSNKIGTTSVWG